MFRDMSLMFVTKTSTTSYSRDSVNDTAIKKETSFLSETNQLQSLQIF